MAPNPPEIYRAFRSGKLEAAGIKLDPVRPPKLKPDQKKLLTTLPDDWLNAIGVETSELQDYLHSSVKNHAEPELVPAGIARRK